MDFLLGVSLPIVCGMRRLRHQQKDRQSSIVIALGPMQQVTSFVLLLVAATRYIQAATNEVDLVEMGSFPRFVAPVGDPGEHLPENPTKGQRPRATSISYLCICCFSRVHQGHPFHSTHVQDARQTDLRHSHLKNKYQVR